MCVILQVEEPTFEHVNAFVFVINNPLFYCLIFTHIVFIKNFKVKITKIVCIDVLVQFVTILICTSIYWSLIRSRCPTK